MKKITNEKHTNGITLVALVVTIVVLLILAGVSLNLVIGQNGLISKAKDAQNRTTEARTNEEKDMNGAADWIDQTVQGNEQITAGSATSKNEDETLTTLSWDELKIEENGKKYGYNPFGIYDDYIQAGTSYKNSKLISISVPDSVTTLEEYAFGSCTNLKSIIIPASVTEIVNYTFLGCEKLEYINFEGTQDQWNAITKGTDWNYNTGDYTVHCTDGDIAKS